MINDMNGSAGTHAKHVMVKKRLSRDCGWQWLVIHGQWMACNRAHLRVPTITIHPLREQNDHVLWGTNTDISASDKLEKKHRQPRPCKSQTFGYPSGLATGGRLRNLQSLDICCTKGMARQLKPFLPKCLCHVPSCLLLASVHVSGRYCVPSYFVKSP